MSGQLTGRQSTDMLMWTHVDNPRPLGPDSAKQIAGRLAHFLGVYAENGDFVVKVSRTCNRGSLEISNLDYLCSDPEVSVHVPHVLGTCVVGGNQVIVLLDVGQPLTDDDWKDPKVWSLPGVEVACLCMPR